ncbi:O-antigen ligase family protein, partial [Candidatus Uhrbacteria bacterium]|nr:O-antigen ligase family protein [Candidatus Uhrbacteria bacterium]
ASVAVSMLVPAFFGWVQAAQQSIDASSLLGIAAQDPETLGVAVIEHDGGRWLRAYGTFPHPNMFGGFLAFGLLAAAGVTARGRMKRQELLMLMIAALGGGALVMSGSRSAWLAFVAGLAVFHFGHRMNKHKDQQKRASSIILLTTTTIVLIALFMSPVLGSRFDGGNPLEEQSISERTMQWSEARKLALRGAVPFIVGSGAGNYTFALAHIMPLQDVYEYQPVHNVPALIFVELGLLGFLLLVAVVVATDRNIHKRWRTSDSLVAMSLGMVILVVALGDHYLWSQTSGLYLLAIFLAVNTKLGSDPTV